jgi:8-oxo-dGTP diphosphatase
MGVEPMTCRLRIGSFNAINLLGYNRHIHPYTDPHILIAYSDGEVRREFTFVYAAEIESSELKIDDESKQAAWVPLSSAVELPLAESQRHRLKDLMEYQKERRMFLR